jgi:hypothetical protein
MTTTPEQTAELIAALKQKVAQLEQEIVGLSRMAKLHQRLIDGHSQALGLWRAPDTGGGR